MWGSDARTGAIAVTGRTLASAASGGYPQGMSTPPSRLRRRTLDDRLGISGDQQCRLELEPRPVLPTWEPLLAGLPLAAGGS